MCRLSAHRLIVRHTVGPATRPFSLELITGGTSAQTCGSTDRSHAGFSRSTPVSHPRQPEGRILVDPPSLLRSYGETGLPALRMTAMQNDTLAIILGGGQGSRLFPLTATRSKPAVQIGGKYRLIDVPVSGCLHADIRRIYVLTQFNSASLNRHISNTYRLDRFSGGFVEILAAEQTPDNPNWYQGTADAVRQAARHFKGYDARYYLILAGDHLYRMDYRELIDAHAAQGADITIAAQPVDEKTATQMGIFRFVPDGQIVAFEEKPKPDRLREIGRSIPEGATFATHSDEHPFMASMGIYVFSRDILLDMLERESGLDFGRELIPGALGRYIVKAFFYRRYWADVGTLESFYAANIM